MDGCGIEQTKQKQQQNAEETCITETRRMMKFEKNE